MRWLVPTLALMAACSEQEFNVESIPPPSGDLQITGRVCHPLTRTWMPDALVYTHLYDNGDVVYDSASDYTDDGGWYTLEGLVPERDYEIYVQVGHDIIDKFIVGLGAEDLELPPPVGCFDETGIDVAVVSGAYDELQPVLEAMGVSNVYLVDGQVGSEITDFLTDPNAMAEFDMLFFDGGHREDGVIYGSGPVTQVHDNLRQFVSGGGVVFATDWAYDVVEQAWPGKIEFFGDDAVPDAAQVGETGTVPASVTDSTLQQGLGVSSVDVVYDLPVWPLIEATDPSVTVMLTGDAPYRQGLQTGTLPGSPLLVQFAEGSGRVVFSTYRNTANNNEAMVGVLLTLVGEAATN